MQNMNAFVEKHICFSGPKNGGEGSVPPDLFLVITTKLMFKTLLFQNRTLNMVVKTGGSLQVWLLTQFFLFPFCKKSLICLGANQCPLLVNTILCSSSLQLPLLRFGPLKGFLSSHRALQEPSTHFMHCFQNYRDTRTMSGVPRLAWRSQDTINNS